MKEFAPQDKFFPLRADPVYKVFVIQESMCVLYTGSHISCHGLKNLWKVIKVYRTPHEASKSAITDNLQRE